MVFDFANVAIAFARCLAASALRNLLVECDSEPSRGDERDTALISAWTVNARSSLRLKG
ncbi:hypothetical protein DFQ26_007680, partial [Actinomortierella ambigua]